MLRPYHTPSLIECGIDEAGRGCLAGPVYAAAVVLPADFRNDELNDSKQLSDAARRRLRTIIEREATAWAVGVASAEEIDRLNILRATIVAMHRAIDGLQVRPEHLLVDGNRFIAYPGGIPHTTIVKGDATYLSIAAASILAKTYRDDYMLAIDRDYPAYHWQRNKGYPTRDHRDAIVTHGLTPHHRRSFHLPGQVVQLSLFD